MMKNGENKEIDETNNQSEIGNKEKDSIINNFIINNSQDVDVDDKKSEVINNKEISFDNLGIFEKKDNFQKLKINFEKLLKENDINLIKKLFEDKDYNKELDINKLIEIYNDIMIIRMKLLILEIQ